MRLDKFLKVSRLVKRRTVAADLCHGSHAHQNGKVAKASSEVAAGDLLQLRFGRRILTVTVLQVPEKAVPAQSAHTLYQVVSDEKIDVGL